MNYLIDMFYKNYIKFPIMLGFISIILVNILILLHPAKGYELSIYNSTPIIVWILLLFIAFCGMSIIILEVYTENFHVSNMWAYGFVLLLFYRITLLYIPYNRGYHGWIGDHMSHIGATHDIIMVGSFPSENFYPITHILLAEVVAVTNLPIQFVVSYSTTFLSVFSIISIYLIVKYMIQDKRATLLALAASSCVFFTYNLQLMPNGWSVLFFPFALYLIIKSTEKNTDISYRILATIVIALYPFFHVLSALVLGIILIILTILVIVNNNFTHINQITRRYIVLPENYPPLYLMGTLFISFITWILSFSYFDRSIRLSFNSILYGSDVDVIAGLTSQAQKMNFNYYDLLNQIFKEEGVTLIFLGLFFFAIYLLYCRYRREESFKRIAIFIIIILSLSFLYGGYLTSLLPGLSSINGGRILAYVKVLIPLFSGILYINLLSKKKVVGIILTIGIMMVPVGLSMMDIVPSPYKNRPNPQITMMDIQGMEWSLIYKDTNILYATVMQRPYRFADYILGKEEGTRRSDIYKWSEYQIPDHFGYSTHWFLSESLLDDRYLVLTEFDKKIYTTVYKAVGRFDEEDFILLKSDKSVYYLYSNGECEVYYINNFF